MRSKLMMALGYLNGVIQLNLFIAVFCIFYFVTYVLPASTGESFFSRLVDEDKQGGERC